MAALQHTMKLRINIHCSAGSDGSVDEYLVADTPAHRIPCGGSTECPPAQVQNAKKALQHAHGSEEYCFFFLLRLAGKRKIA